MTRRPVQRFNPAGIHSKLWAESLLFVGSISRKVTRKFIPDETGHNGKYVQVDVRRRLIVNNTLIVTWWRQVHVRGVHSRFATTIILQRTQTPQHQQYRRARLSV